VRSSQALRPFSAAARYMERGEGGECDRGEGGRLAVRVGGLGLEEEKQGGGLAATQRAADRDFAGARDRGGEREPRRAPAGGCFDPEPSAPRAGAARVRQRPVTVGSDGRGLDADLGDRRGRRAGGEESAAARLQVPPLCCGCRGYGYRR